MHLPIWAVILLSLLFSFLAAVGVNLQKLSMTKEEASSTSRPPYFQPLWLLGLSVIALDAVGDFIFIGMAPQSLLVPLGALSLGFNFILAPIFHNEVVTLGIVVATAIVYCGTIVTVLFAPKDKSDYDLEDIRLFAMNPQFLWFELFSVFFACGTFFLGATKGYGPGHYCALAGCFGGQTLLLAKCLSELLLNAVLNDDFSDWTGSPIPYFMVIAMVGCLLTQLNFLNTGLRKFEALRVGPMYQCFFIVFGITGGLVFFQEYHYMTWKDLIIYSVGIIILLVGVAVLVRQRAVASSPNDETLFRDNSSDSLLEGADIEENENSDGLSIREQDQPSIQQQILDAEASEIQEGSHPEMIIT
eukprot:CCRYP_007785-RA/>CCRYP_007785-RA protein AED:0.36 eAED:0.36 QI:290/1/1/1/1/1/2/1924/358